MTTNEIRAKLASLAELDRSKLAERWVEVFDCPAPRKCQAQLLRGALAWHLQMSHQGMMESGGLERMRRQFRRSAASLSQRGSLGPGTRLLREWQGKTHHVKVLDRGFEYNDKTYRSLTAIARHITGTPWSGPQFFGLRS